MRQLDEIVRHGASRQRLRRAALASAVAVAVLLVSWVGLIALDRGQPSVVLVANEQVILDGAVGTVVAVRSDVEMRDSARRVIGVATGIHVTEGAHITGDVHTTRPPVIEPGGAIAGTVHALDAATFARGLSGPWGFVTSLAFTASLLAIGAAVFAVAPCGMEAAHRAGVTQPLASSLVGLAVAVGLPLAALLAALTIVGLPLAVGLVSTFVMLGAVGFVVTARILGGLLLGDAGLPIAAVALGLLLLGISAVLPLLGIVIPAASTYGLGAVGVAVWRHRTGRVRVPAGG